MQILTSNLVSVHNPDIPTRTSVLADRTSLFTVRYFLLGACIWVASRNPLLANLSFPLFSCTSLPAACWSLIAALLVARHKAYVTSSFSLINVRCSWYPVVHCVLYIYLLASCSHWRYSLLAVRCSMFDLRYSLCYRKLATHYYLFAVCSPITAWLLLLACWTPSFSLLAPHHSPHVCSMLTTSQSLLHAGSSRPTVHFFLFSTRCWQIVVPSS